MVQMKHNNIIALFHLICWFASVSVSLYWVYKYNQNEDLSVVNNKKFYQESDDVFPVLSLCFKDPFPEADFLITGTTTNVSNYVKFLGGQYFEEEMLRIDFQNITMNVLEYAEEIYIKWKDGSYKSYPAKNHTDKLFEPTYSGFGFFQERFYQCYGIEIPHEKNIQIFSVLLRNEVFLRTKTTKNYEFMTFLHYPNQLLRSVGSMKYKWEAKSPNASIDISFRVKDMEILHRRNKFNMPCNENWENHDKMIIENHLADKGCRPPYLFSAKPFAPCVSVEEIKKSQFSIRADEYDTHPPCQSMDKIIFTYEEDDITGFPWAKPGHTWIGMNLFIDHFKMIEHTR